jgi:hypothetical protein
MAFGFVPYSKINYSIFKPSTADTINYSQLFTGRGGANKFFIAYGKEIKRNLSVGVNAGYLFGPIYKEQFNVFKDSIASFNTHILERINFNGIQGNFGVQYSLMMGDTGKFNFKDTLSLRKITFGINYEPELYANASRERLAQRYLYNTASGTSAVVDTISFIHGKTDSTSRILLPTRLRAGFFYDNYRKFGIGMDFQFGNEKVTNLFGYNAGLSNSYTISVGGYVVPFFGSSNYLELVSYRFGAHYSKLPITVNNNSVTDIGISFGFTLPNRQKLNPLSNINFGFELGQRGNVANIGLKESYFKASLSFSLIDRFKWFEQRKYD